MVKLPPQLKFTFSAAICLHGFTNTNAEHMKHIKPGPGSSPRTSSFRLLPLQRFPSYNFLLPRYSTILALQACVHAINIQRREMFAPRPLSWRINGHFHYRLSLWPDRFANHVIGKDGSNEAVNPGEGVDPGKLVEIPIYMCRLMAMKLTSRRLRHSGCSQ